MENRILIIDDNAGFVSQVTEILQEEDYKVGFALNAKDGLNKLDAGNYDLVILDINMPEMNGFEVLEELKNSKTHKLIPVLMSTASANKEVVLKAMKYGADDYIVKPIDVDSFLDKVYILMRIRGFVKKWGVLPR